MALGCARDIELVLSDSPAQKKLRLCGHLGKSGPRVGYANTIKYSICTFCSQTANGSIECVVRA